MSLVLAFTGILAPKAYRLTVFGSGGRGLHDLSGLVFDGDNNAIAGGDYIKDFSVVPEAGDYNYDGAVNTLDSAFWKTHYGESTGIGLQADGGHNGVVDAAGYVLWRKFNGTPPAPSPIAPAAAIQSANDDQMAGATQQAAETPSDVSSALAPIPLSVAAPQVPWLDQLEYVGESFDNPGVTFVSAAASTHLESPVQQVAPQAVDQFFEARAASPDSKHGRSKVAFISALDQALGVISSRRLAMVALDTPRLGLATNEALSPLKAAADADDELSIRLGTTCIAKVQTIHGQQCSPKLYSAAYLKNADRRDHRQTTAYQKG
jgi:hypothetical protein